ncbi:LOW QUALITY PROTEIN: nodulation-signaling pathway 2 protein-like [Phalaenopsis equestris]|uniref:LOW QUALITY PROTEIN: nodulation-signaling pathway 2 protein-like n=1 Tax=Phalaenopsis equestris TaxID=78828 RepID=UPI0009E4AE3A|nr:LOW QUALITY PROTEIN: nodulation-signaling pathway 2 protein-like [Phalaenopsis equestris]
MKSTVTISPKTSTTQSTPPSPPPPSAQQTPAAPTSTSLRLLHLLIAAAESLTGSLQSSDLTEVILARLKELLSCGCSSSIDRLAAHFTDALHSLLHGSGNAASPPKFSFEYLEAFQLMQDMSPYIKFGHFTANQAILEAVAGERRVHIIDFDITVGVQWASLMQALVSVSNGWHPPHLKITAVARNRKSVQETGRRLAAYAASIGLPFSFAQCRLDEDDQFRPTGVKVVRGEVVVFNCILQPGSTAGGLSFSPVLRRRGSAAGGLSFIAGAAAMGARVVTIVEEEGEAVGFEGRFVEEMVRYSAICDAMEAGFGGQERAREAVERVFLGPRIAGAVGRAYRGTERWEKIGEMMEAAEFGRVGLSFFNICQARLLLSLFNGYQLEEEGCNKIVLCWKTCRLISASVWSAPPLVSPEGSLL